ncbi:MAG: DUF72 domain-containing protein [Chloroflexi bacterium]|nr:DUF72 domain-containing protein [Chloroflexota bacterium]
MIYLGTSGFSYDDWIGGFYPTGLPKKDWLTYYSREFDTCEINSTYYAVPGQSTLQAMMAKTGEGFLLCFKANKAMTHQRENNASTFESFKHVLEPVAAAGKLGCILAQFPNSFRFSQGSWDYLGWFREQLKGLPLVIEFRNAQWLRPEVFDWMRQHELGFCCVDEPKLPGLLPPLAEVTGQVGYVRFHGRNAAKWWHHTQAYERYNYSYSPEELAEWVPRIRQMDTLALKTFVFANNHWRAQAIGTIRQLKLMLD